MKQKIEKLMENCVQYFEQHSFSIPRIDRYKYLWRQKLMPFMARRSLLYYDASVGDRFIRSKIAGIITPYERDIIRSIYVLTEFLEKGTICKRRRKSPKQILSGPIGQLMEGFLLHLESLRRSESTLRGHRIYLFRLLTYLESKQVLGPADIRECHILTFLSSSTNSKIGMISSIRLFLIHLYENHFLQADLSASLRHFKWNRSKRLPSVYSKGEVSQIEASVRRSDATGKRDYAMLLLATRLGLRASDIAHLNFSNMDWERNTITLTQFKTGKEIILPLLADVGEAIIDYLKYGRKSSQSDRIFLYTRAPFSPMENGAVSSAIQRVIETSGVEITGRRHGPHSMRHSLASRFLENKESMPVISEALGHNNTDTTMNYLRIDIASLRQCALDVPPVSSHFYKQKGGAFYENF